MPLGQQPPPRDDHSGQPTGGSTDRSGDSAGLVSAPGKLPADRARAAFADAVATQVLHRDPAASPMRRGVAALVAVVLVLVAVAVAGFLVEFLRGGKSTAYAGGTPGGTAPTSAPSASSAASPGTGGPAGGATASSRPTGTQQEPPTGTQQGVSATPTTAPAVALANGNDPAVTANQSRPATAAASAKPTPAAAARAVTYSAIAGPGCASNDSAHNWYAWGVYRDGTAGWYDINGGFGGDGCSGSAMAMPMSGGTGATGKNYVVWWFETAPVVAGSCTFSIYVPTGGSARDVAANPAVYKVLGGRTSTTAYARFSINQAANRGRWVGVGPVEVRNGAISLHLEDSGRDPNGEHIGVAQARVSCTAT
ncbi:hypothetical protein [Micromonospora sp. NBC_01813]|uniref:hypothetical protein n=1 Tax=Micromonospora sp. NBC_01813 TaxID=2975988 RepID=UPI002DD91DD8|nr:hypothetical protein [Micromonospora sp. NBC_01813]WSA07148.1 hypothetical protein OG958_23195 [Micromonospora sp. NBC_01813]